MHAAHARLATGLLALALAAGCGVQQQIQSAVEPDQVSADVSRDFQVPADRMVQAVRRSLEDLTLVARGESRRDSSTWLLTAVSESGQSGSSGELVEIHVRSLGDGASVRIVTRRRSRVDPGARGDWSPQIFRRIEARLAER